MANGVLDIFQFNPFVLKNIRSSCERADVFWYYKIPIFN